MEIMRDAINIFLRESNAIESEYSDEAFRDSVVAWEYAVSEYKNWGIDYVCGIHEKLMCNLDSDIAGKLRKKTVYIVGTNFFGERKVIREILAKGNKPRLRKWCEKYEGCKDLDELKEAHIDFEMIHPFLDGNGRTGRILYNVQRVHGGIGVNVFYEKEKAEYYEWFRERQREEKLIKLMSEL